MNELNLQKPAIDEDVKFNCAYYPVVFKTQEHCELIFNELKKHEIFARRYFYPVLSQVGYVNQVPVPVAESISKRILCLPIYYELAESEIDLISRIILRTLKYAPR